MFFIVSKLFWFVAQPLNFFVFLALLALALRLAGRQRAAGRTLALLCLGMVLAVWTPLGTILLTPLEQRFPRPDLPEKIAGIIVLGGGTEGAINLHRHGYELNSAGDRLVETAVLARRFPEAKILVSGGVGTLVLDAESDAESSVRLFAVLGIPADRMIVENRSRDTYENAVLAKAMVQPKPDDVWLLVTSAFHMPRSVGLFRKAGFEIVPWPCDYRTSGQHGLALLTDYTGNALDNLSTALREWLGLLAYWLSGRTDALFPGPS